MRMLTLLRGVRVRCGRVLAEQLTAEKAALNARVAGLAAQVEQLTQTSRRSVAAVRHLQRAEEACPAARRRRG